MEDKSFRKSEDLIEKNLMNYLCIDTNIYSMLLARDRGR